MSNGVLAALCCCGESCVSDCCDMWACSPAGPINITFSGHKVETTVFSPMTRSIVTEEIHWTITATLTRSGATCADYKYSAATCVLSYQRITRFNWDIASGPSRRWRCQLYEGVDINGDGQITIDETCLPLGEPFCQSADSCGSWNCKKNPCNCGGLGIFGMADGCVGCGCIDAVNLDIKLLGSYETNFTGTIAGTSGGGTGPGHNGLRVPNSVITLTCTTECGPCKKPILLFYPNLVPHQATSTQEACGDPCWDTAVAGPCSNTFSEPLSTYVRGFAVLGTGACFNSTNFDVPLNSAGGDGIPVLMGGYDCHTISGLGCPFGVNYDCLPMQQSYSSKMHYDPETQENIFAAYCTVDRNCVLQTVSVCFIPPFDSVTSTDHTWNWTLV